MDFNTFYKEIKRKLNEINIDIEEKKANKLYNYMNLILQWNEKINLTAITNEEEFIEKHFVDSLTIEKYIKEKDKLIDVGTGAGFPGIPLNIYKDGCKYTLLDSLNKRIIFLQDTIEKLNLKNIETIHGRAEEIGKNKLYREQFDVATSRAVAPLNILLEYLLPFVKIGGICICMKGSNIEEEIENSKKAINILGGKIENIEKINLPESDITRNIIIIKKVKETPIKYPRKAGMPSKEPL